MTSPVDGGAGSSPSPVSPGSSEPQAPVSSEPHAPVSSEPHAPVSSEPHAPVPSQRRALRLLAWGAIAAVIWVARPFGVGLFLGVLLAFTLQPNYRRLRARGWRAGPAALVCVLGAMSLITAAIAGFTTLFVGRALTWTETLPQMLERSGELRVFFVRAMGAIHIDPDAALGEMNAYAATLGTGAAGLAADAAGLTLSGLLASFFMGLSAYYVLRYWEEIVRHAERLLPFAPEHTRTFLGELRAVGQSVLRGTVLTGLLQGLVAGIGYWITGVPDPAFFGALTCFASLIPVVGTLLVWLPAGIYLIATGHPAAGIVELGYGSLLVVGLIDYLVRPIVIGRQAHIPFIFTFVALFGGIEVFGLVGVVLGPVLVTLCLAILRTYEQRAIEE